FFFSSRRRHTRLQGDWSSDVCSSDLSSFGLEARALHQSHPALEIGADLRGELLGRIADRLDAVPGEALQEVRTLDDGDRVGVDRSEERRVGKEWRSGR